MIRIEIRYEQRHEPSSDDELVGRYKLARGRELSTDVHRRINIPSAINCGENLHPPLPGKS